VNGGRVVRVCEPLDGRILCVFLLIGDEGAVLIDTGGATTPEHTIAPALERCGLTWDDVRAVVVTHADVDHSGGLGAVRRLAPRARTVAGAADKPLIESVDRLLELRYRELARDHGVDQDAEFGSWVRASADDGTIDVAVASDTRLRIDNGWSVDLLTAPGHSAGHLVVHDAASATTIAADAVLGAGIPGSDGAPAFAPTYRYLGAYRATIERLRGLGSRRLLCSHVPELRDAAVGEYLDASAQFCERLERELLTVLSAGSKPYTLAELIEGVGPRIGSWPPEANGTLAQPLAGHLDDLQLRGVVSALPGRPLRYAARHRRVV
jgi:glyoxylase-like metal-dependent hydrolase (beta-lactamase superfamily II)